MRTVESSDKKHENSCEEHVNSNGQRFHRFNFEAPIKGEVMKLEVKSEVRMMQVAGVGN